MRALGRLVVFAWLAVALFAPWLAPYGATEQFPGLAYAPPTRLHAGGGDGWGPWFHPLVARDPLRRSFDEDRSRAVHVGWLQRGRLFGTAPDDPPVLLIGADALGRDLFSRLLVGVRHSLALAVLSVALSLTIGAAAGLVAGYRGGIADAALQRLADFVIVLPVLYVLLALRAVLPIELAPGAVFGLMATIFAAVGWPLAARGVRAIAARERGRDYVAAAEAAAASPLRIMARHLLPAAAGYLRTQALLLLPAFVVAEATLSYAGLGFPDSAPGWGTLLADAANIGALGGAIWLLVPALALASLVLGVNLALDAAAPTAEFAAPARPAMRALTPRGPFA
jgi:peptide/nickel transport system permease protein